MKTQSQVLLLAALLLTSTADTLWAQEQSTSARNPNRPETELLKTIVLITVEAKEPDQPAKPGKQGKAGTPVQLGKTITEEGTGFLVNVPDPRLINSNVKFIYLVTNRHVAEAIKQDESGNCTPRQIQKTYVTMNLKEPVNGSHADKQPLILSQKVHWYFPKDEAIDLAVMPFPVNSKYDYRWISLEQFLTTEILDKKQVVPGDKVLTSGYFYLYSGSHNFQPILREGVLAMLPVDPISTTTCKSGKLYFADVHVIPGNSGSPIFIIPGLGLGVGESLGGVPTTFGLLGVVSGYMQETEGLTLKASTSWEGSIHTNSGIAAVVPAQELEDLLESPELQSIRDEVMENSKRRLP